MWFVLRKPEGWPRTPGRWWQQGWETVQTTLPPLSRLHQDCTVTTGQKTNTITNTSSHPTANNVHAWTLLWKCIALAITLVIITVNGNDWGQRLVMTITLVYAMDGLKRWEAWDTLFGHTPAIPASSISSKRSRHHIKSLQLISYLQRMRLDCCQLLKFPNCFNSNNGNACKWQRETYKCIPEHWDTTLN